MNAAVTANGTYSFLLATNNTDGLTMVSREGTNKPQLVITFSGTTLQAAQVQGEQGVPSESATPLLTETPQPTATEAALTQQVVESDSALVLPSGAWTAYDTEIASGGRYVYSSGSSGDALELAFQGTQVDVVYVQHPALGSFDLEVDGVVMQTVNSTADDTVFGSQVTVNGLAEGEHILRVVAVDGTVAIDAFVVEAPPALPTETPSLPVLPSEVPEEVQTELPTATLTPSPTATNLPPGLSVLTLLPEADAQVQQEAPDMNFGTETTLEVQDGEAARESYLRFTVSGVSGVVERATLRVSVASSAEDESAVSVYLASSDWAETGITWQTRPVRSSSPADDEEAETDDSWVELDVTSLVQGNGTVSFVLASDSPEGVSLSSREGSAPPELVIVWESNPLSPPILSPVPTETPTETPTPTELPTVTPLPTIEPPTETPLPTLEPPTEAPVIEPTVELAATTLPVTESPTDETPVP